MPLDNDIMGMIGQQPGAMPPGGGDAPQAPMAAPMSAPQPKFGNREGAMVNLSMASDLLEQALPGLGAETPEGAKALSALNILYKILGPQKEKTGQLQSAEIQQLMQSLPQAGGASPEAKAMQAPQQPGAMPGQMPGGMPGQPPM